MKKNLFVLLATLILAVTTSCNETNNSSSFTQPTTSDVTNTDSSIVDSSSDVVTNDSFDESKYIAKTFVNVNELYMLPNETYNLSVMGENTSNLKYVSDMEDYLTVNNKGIMTAISNNNQEKLSIPVYIHNDTHYQKITVNVVDYMTYGNAFSSVDKGRLYGKKAVFFGDSITHNWARYTHEMTVVPNSTPSSINNSYVKMLNDVCKFEKFTNAAWSGGTMAYIHEANQIGRLPEKSLPVCIENNIDAVKEADYIFIYYGTNDLTDQIKPGKLTDSMTIDGQNDSTFAAAMKYGIERIRSVKENANIIFLNIAYRTYPANGQYTIDDYNKIIFDTCRYYIVKHIDTYSMYDHRYSTTYLNTDGLHLNDTGHQALADYLLNDGVKKA